jgi:hypothetical protein
MERSLTDLEKGIFCYIDAIQLELLREKKGFLERENYPDFYKEISVENEVGRFLFFRFMEINI